MHAPVPWAGSGGRHRRPQSRKGAASASGAAAAAAVAASAAAAVVVVVVMKVALGEEVEREEVTSEIPQRVLSRWQSLAPIPPIPPPLTGVEFKNNSIYLCCIFALSCNWKKITIKPA